MRWQTVLKTSGAILSAIFTATSVVLSAQGIRPSTHWQYLALGGFIVFAGLMSWMLWGSNQQIHRLGLKLASRRPTIALGQKLGASTHPRDVDKEVDIALHPTWRNIGESAAYQLCLHSGYAPVEFLDQFKTMPNLNVPNPIYSAEEFGPVLQLKQPFVKRKGGEREVRSATILMYCGIEYSDAPQGGNKYSDEWWFAYPLGALTIAAAHMEQKQALEPYVRKAFGERK